VKAAELTNAPHILLSQEFPKNHHANKSGAKTIAP
jgi:hypothetical protein